MQVKSFVATIGLGIAAGATAVLMLPKDSKVYRAADDAAQKLKSEAGRMVNNVTK